MPIYSRLDPRYTNLLIRIRLETLKEEIYITEPKYSIPVLLANIGGQLGLFTGFSALTGFEILELFTDLCHAIGRRLVASFWWGAQVFPAGGASGGMA